MNTQNYCVLERPVHKDGLFTNHEQGEFMHTNTQFRTELFSQSTKRDMLEVLKNWGFVTGLFSNMDDEEKELFRRFQERAG